MASSLRITTGPLAAGPTYQNDTAVQAILMRFAKHIGAEGTNQQKLDAIAMWCVRQIQDGAAQEQMATELEAVRASIREGNVLA